MRQAGLICRRKPRYVHTTDSNHGEPVYANLIKDLPIEAPNQCWVADLCTPAGRLCVLGLSAGCLLTQMHWLELGSQDG